MVDDEITHSFKYDCACINSDTPSAVPAYLHVIITSSSVPNLYCRLLHQVSESSFLSIKFLWSTHDQQPWRTWRTVSPGKFEESVKCGIRNNWPKMKVLWTLPTLHVQLPSSKVTLSVMCCRGTMNIGPTLNSFPIARLRSAVILSLCEGTTTTTLWDYIIYKSSARCRKAIRP